MVDANDSKSLTERCVGSSPTSGTMQKVIAIVGPTAVGKSDFAVELALAIGGEVISADSRQIYKGLDIGTGKITQSEMHGIPHHLLDIATLTDRYSIVEFQADAQRMIADIHARGKMPILCGGTGFYIDAVLYGHAFPDAPLDQKLREKLAQKSATELFAELAERDPERARTIDKHNKVKLIRALEIVNALGKVPALKTEKAYDSLVIGLTVPIEELRQRIAIRLEKRLEHGMVEEVERLLKEGATHERLFALGLEYRFISQYLKHLLSYEEMKNKLALAIGQYARRQLFWFKRNKEIIWLTPGESKKAIELAERFKGSRN
jgi:tRNA dimethylallyltransferase